MPEVLSGNASSVPVCSSLLTPLPYVSSSFQHFYFMLHPTPPPHIALSRHVFSLKSAQAESSRYSKGFTFSVGSVKYVGCDKLLSPEKSVLLCVCRLKITPRKAVLNSQTTRTRCINYLETRRDVILKHAGYLWWDLSAVCLLTSFSLYRLWSVL